MAATIAVIFDFDDTLAHDSTSTFLESLGIDVKVFWREHLELLRNGWDPVPAYLQKMIELSGQRPIKERITKRKLAAAGRLVEFHRGVSGLFQRARNQLRAVSPEMKLEFYVVSSGIGEIIRATSMARLFTDIWASDFAYNEENEIAAVKNVVSFTDKTRFIFQISKGITGASARRDPFAVNQRIESEKLHVPLHHMIVVGDGFTDVPCFSLVQKGGGIAIGVYDRTSRDRWGKAWGFLQDNRVKHLVAADYRKHSGLDDALSLALDKIAKDISLQRVTYQG